MFDHLLLKGLNKVINPKIDFSKNFVYFYQVYLQYLIFIYLSFMFLYTLI